MRSRAARLFEDYASAHRTSGNRLCHSIGIPSIVLSVVAGLAAVRLGAWMTAAEPVVAAVAVAEIAIDPLGGVLFLLFCAAADAAGRSLAAAAGLRETMILAGALFAIGWIFQLVGHAVFEKNRPAFARNLRHLLIGPLWISRKAIGRGR